MSILEVVMKSFSVQFLKFLAVGGVGVIVNLVVFFILRTTVFNHVHYGVIYSSIIATLVAIGTNWLGSRYWSFRHGFDKTQAYWQGTKFIIVSLAALLIPVACVWVSHYVLGFVSPVADAFANNVIGLALGTCFRFAFYKWWVFKPTPVKASES